MKFITHRVLPALFLAGLLLGSGCGDDSSVSERAASLTGGGPSTLGVQTGTGGLNLTWTPVSGATGHNVYWDTAPGVTTAAPNSQLGLVGSSAFISPLTNGTAYYFIITAIIPAGEGDPSGEVQGTPLGVPGGIFAMPEQGKATISWQPVAGAASYTVYWDTAPGVTTASPSSLGGVINLFVEIPSLTVATNHYFIVTANNAGGAGDASSEASAYTDVQPGNMTVLLLGASGQAFVAGYISPFGFAGINLGSPGAPPPLATLLNYNAVLLWDDSGSITTATSDLLGAYLDRGGAVVTGAYVHYTAWPYAGQMKTGGYSPFKFDATNPNTPEILGAVYLPAHPIMAGVGFINIWSRSNPTMAAGGIRIADSTSGEPLVAVNTPGTMAGVTFWPADGGTLGGDFAQMIVNALVFTAKN